jgi:hypothetical protein
MNLAWYEAGKRGEKPAMPALRDFPKINESIFRQHRRRSLKAVLEDYDAFHHRMVELIRQVPDSDLVSVARFLPTGASWILSDCIRANTSSHYRWAQKHIWRWLREKSQKG